ncbi:Membrane protein TerC, possibly involved in tellurium resistance [Cohaesibacter sp. ES.047]|uniref:TerC family protein n=1 Tax=Cohaesibacter sp. ES.047 TaxID=1798205 RepID=UPI000BB99816|nr:TerC family protein [Cohaesibacter sp. ES.047]SNY93337.1 Membrane protein TerC, possibly involved in tellurium resistance [Cohaesibacter sp. ES.047]
MFQNLLDPTILASLLTLTAMEIVLGIDNVVFISVLVSKLPADMAKRARAIGILLALVFRIALLLALTWLIGLTEPVFTLFDLAFSWRDLIMIAGGLFLIYKALAEIHLEVEFSQSDETKIRTGKAEMVFGAAILQIVIIDLVFSIDSIVTAIGMAKHVEVMITAMVIAMAVMYAASGPIAHFIERHKTTKMLALSFLMLIGFALVGDGVGMHIPRGYIYAMMGFAVLVEILNIFALDAHRRRKLAMQKNHIDAA